MANYNVEVLLSDLKLFTEKLTEVYSNLNLYLTDPSTELVNISEVLSDISVNNLLSAAVISSEASSGLDRGAITDAVYRAAALERELGMRADRKADYYIQAEAELNLFTNKLLADEGKALNRIRGKSRE